MAERGRRFPVFRISLCLLLLAAAFLAVPSARAQDVYTATGIAVDLEGDISGLRERALAQAQRAAFRKVLEQVADPGALAGLALPGDAEIGLWVEDFEIEDEKIAANRYIGRFTFRFQAAPIQDFLTENGIAFVEAIGKPVLVLPLYGDPSGAYHLWGPGNPWLGAWQAAPADNGLAPILLPSGDAMDQRALSLDQAMAGDLAAFSALAARYGAGAIIIADAALQPMTASGETDLDLRLGVPGTPIDRAAPAFLRAGNTGGDIAALFAQAIGEARAKIAADWKSGSLVDPNQRNVIAVSVPLSGLDQWVAIKRRLATVPLLKSVNLKELSRAEAELDLSYIGAPDAFTAALAGAGLALEELGEGAAILSLASGTPGLAPLP